MDRRIFHAVAVPEQVIERPRSEQSKRIASEGALTSDVPAVQSISADAGAETVAGVLGGQGAELTSAELEQLFGASGISVIPYFGDKPNPSKDGYYATEDITVDQPVASQNNLAKFDGKLIKKGTRRSHRRAVLTAPTDVDNPFASASTEEVGIPARASDVQWYDRRNTGTTETASIVRTVVGQHDDIAIYDVSDSSFTGPALIYDVPYADWPADVRVYDDRNNPRRKTVSVSGPAVGSATVGDSTVGREQSFPAFQRVYRTDHNAVGTLRIENDRLQVALNEDRGRLIARRWDESDGQYEPVQLDVTSDWRLERADVRYIGLEGVEARLRFGDGTATHRFDAALKRGYDDVLFVNAPNAGSAPSGLTTRLDAIAHDSDRDPAGTADIVAREAL